MLSERMYETPLLSSGVPCSWPSLIESVCSEMPLYVEGCASMLVDAAATLGGHASLIVDVKDCARLVDGLISVSSLHLCSNFP